MKETFSWPPARGRRIRKIRCHYYNNDGFCRKFVLVERSYYALADGFDAYRALDPNRDRTVYQPQDAAVAAKLEDMYDSESMENIEHEAKALKKEEQNRILRFYRGLRLKIAAFSEFFEAE